MPFQYMCGWIKSCRSLVTQRTSAIQGYLGVMAFKIPQCPFFSARALVSFNEEHLKRSTSQRCRKKLQYLARINRRASSQGASTSTNKAKTTRTFHVTMQRLRECFLQVLASTFDIIQILINRLQVASFATPFGLKCTIASLDVISSFAYNMLLWASSLQVANFFAKIKVASIAPVTSTVHVVQELIQASSGWLESAISKAEGTPSDERDVLQDET